MTNKEATNLLDNLIGIIEDNQNNDYDTALMIAIRALIDNEHIDAKWIRDTDLEHGKCSKCGCIEDLVDGHSSYRWCSNCGAKMVEEQTGENTDG